MFCKYYLILKTFFRTIFSYQGVAAKQAKNSSVKKLMLLATVPGIPENYFNVKTILDNLNLESVEFTVAADIKMCKIKKCKILYINLEYFRHDLGW